MSDRPPPSSAERRQRFRADLVSGRLLSFPGAFSPLVGKLVDELGFDGIYVSGAALSADLGLPDIGLTTLTEVAGRGEQIARATTLPILIDADTGFGEPLNVARTIRALEDAGMSGCHIEDQVNPKRCGHLDHKSVVGRDQMVRRVRAATAARRDPNFVICARTDAFAIEGMKATIDRAKAYVDAGADMVFPEALPGEREFAAIRESIDVPLLANMTEFGKSPLLARTTLETLGFNVVIYPVTTLRLAMGAIEEGLRALRRDGTQVSLLDRMQTRARLYELLGYADYDAFDADVFNFDLETGGRDNDHHA